MLDLRNQCFTYNNVLVYFALDEKKHAWFKGKEVATLLGYTNTRKAIRDHVKKTQRKSFHELTMGTSLFTPTSKQPHAIFINEPGLYRMVMFSKMPYAENFQELIYDSILPFLREHKERRYLEYIAKRLEEKNNDVATMMKRLEEKNNDVATMMKRLEEKNHSVENMTKQLQEKTNEIEKMTKQLQEKTNEVENMKRQLLPRAVKEAINAASIEEKKNYDKLKPTFILLKIDEPNFKYSYYTICVQKRNVTRQLTQFKKKHPKYEELLRIEYDSTPLRKMLYRIRWGLIMQVKFFHNYFAIRNDKLTEQQLLEEIHSIVKMHSHHK